VVKKDQNEVFRLSMRQKRLVAGLLPSPDHLVESLQKLSPVVNHALTHCASCPDKVLATLPRHPNRLNVGKVHAGRGKWK